MVKADATFTASSQTLERLITREGNFGSEESAFALLYFIAKQGSKLQDLLEFFPKVHLQDIFVDDDGLRLMNPYVYDAYIECSFRVFFIFLISVNCADPREIP